MGEIEGVGVTGREPIRAPPTVVLFSRWGLAATRARSGTEGGGACAVGVQRSRLFGAVLKDADQA